MCKWLWRSTRWRRADSRRPSSRSRRRSKAPATTHLKALAYNALGDYYLKSKQPDEAFWHYLRVDAVYTQDREEHARALYNLWKLFESVRGDAQRSNESLEKLEDKSLAGTDYAARAEKETAGDKKTP